MKSKPKTPAYRKRRRAYKKRRRNTPGKEVTLHIPFKRGCQMFPDRYIVKGHTQYSFSILNNGSAGVQAYYDIMLVSNAITANNGPAFSNAGHTGFGSFSTNVPAGCYYLLGDSNKGGSGQGANAPYGLYRVNSSFIKVTITPVMVSNASPIEVVIYPSTQYSNLGQMLGAPTGSVAEQPYAKNKQFGMNSMDQSKSISSSMSTLRLVGDRYKSSLENGSFDGNLGSLPVFQTFWNIRTSTISASSVAYALSYSAVVDLYQDIEFFFRNTYISSAPA